MGGVSGARPLPPWLASPPAVIAANEGGQQLGNYYFNNGLFNPGTGSAQTATVYSKDQWSVVSTQPGAAVRSYPSMAYACGWPVSSYTAISTAFAESRPATGFQGEWAADVFFNSTSGNAISTTLEMMVWTDTLGAVPAGNVVGTTNFSGHQWNLYQSLTLQPWPYYAFLSADNWSAGTVDLLAPMLYLIAQGYMTPGYLINTIFWGWEIITATNGLFTCSDLNVSVTGGAGGPVA